MVFFRKGKRALINRKMGRLKAGATKKDITPPIGIHLSGYIKRFGPSTGIHDPLLANFLWVDDGFEGFLFISMDVLNISDEFAAEAKKGISEALGVEDNKILIASTHTHSAPGIHLFRNSGMRDKAWEEKVFHILISGSREALQNAKRAFLGIGKDQSNIGINRRKREGKTDADLSLACFFDDKKEPFAVIANYGCHPVVLDEANFHISADYVDSFRCQFESSFSSHMTILFFTGATGDVDPIERGDFSISKKLGEALALKALGITNNMELKADVEFKASRAFLRIPYGWLPSLEEAEIAYKENLLQYQKAVDKGDNTEIMIRQAFLLWAEDLRRRTQEKNLPKYLDVELQSLKLGDAIFLACPFELFSSLSLELRKSSETENLFIICYANGYQSYLPDEEAIQEGGYEVEEAYKYVGLLPYSSLAPSLFLECARSLIKATKK